MSFEGSEKKIELVVREGTPSLRNKDRYFWEGLVHACQATILSSIENDEVTAYLLSESSLFVWDDRFLMITCGQTRLIDSVVSFLREYNVDQVASLIFQRKNEYYSHLQETDFIGDVERLKKIVPGKAFRFGELDGHHTFLFHMDRDYIPKTDDQTFELLMYHIDSRAREVFFSQNKSLEEIRQFMKLDEVLQGFQIDDFLFEPCGYSLNAIKGDYYATIHVTPEKEASYVSFESNFDVTGQGLVKSILDILKPASFDIIAFNQGRKIDIHDHYQKIDAVEEKLSCGYQVDYRHYGMVCSDKKKATEL